MLTPEQIKGRIKNIAEKKDLRPQEVLQMFLFERVLERLSASEYKSNFILKGGLLISSMIGISERTTMDMDTTVRGIQMEEDEIVEIVKKIIAIDVDDGIQFEFQRIEPIREDDAYNNFRIHLIAKYGKINNPMKMDVTTGDVITPAAISFLSIQIISVITKANPKRKKRTLLKLLSKSVLLAVSAILRLELTTIHFALYFSISL